MRLEASLDGPGAMRQRQSSVLPRVATPAHYDFQAAKRLGWWYPDDVADHGVKDIKPERPPHEDQNRNWGPFKNGSGAYYALINRYKLKIEGKVKDSERNFQEMDNSLQEAPDSTDATEGFSQEDKETQKLREELREMEQEFLKFKDALEVFPQGVLREPGVSDYMDDDLDSVLENASNEDLEPLVKCILEAPDRRFFSSDNFKQDAQNHKAYIKQLGFEIRRFGSENIYTSWYKKQPEVDDSFPSYRQIVLSVARRLKLSFLQDEPVDRIEYAILGMVMRFLWFNKSEAERKTLLESIYWKTDDLASPPDPLPEGMLLAAKRLGWFPDEDTLPLRFTFSKLTWNISLMLGEHEVGAVFNGDQVLTTARTGPDYSVTAPCVCYVGLLRLRQKAMRGN
jgi:hypothetical protein